MVDHQAPRVKVHLAADAAGQERVLTAIFAVADDRMADRRHVDAQLVRAAGERLEFDPGGTIAGAVDHAVAGPGGSGRLLRRPASSRRRCRAAWRSALRSCLRRLRARRPRAPNRSSSPSGPKSAWKRTLRCPACGRSAARRTYPCRAGGPAAGAARLPLAKASSRPSTCSVVLVPPCVAKSRRLVEHDRGACPVDHHRFGLGRLRPRSAACVRGHARCAVSPPGRYAQIAGPGRAGRRACARLPSTRTCPVRAQRDTVAKPICGRCRLNQRSSRIAVIVGADGELADFSGSILRHSCRPPA